ncbi:MAG: hypothetical protein ACRC8D_07250 [Aeromonas sp.]
MKKTVSRSIKIKATSQLTGEEFVYDSIRDAARKGGFNYNSIRWCLLGIQGSHVGFVFERLSPPRPPSNRSTVTTRVAQLRNEGLSNAQIAERLNMDQRYVAMIASHAILMGLTKKYHTVQRELKRAA